MKKLVVLLSLIICACQGQGPILDPEFSRDEERAIQAQLSTIERLPMQLNAEFAQSSKGQAFTALFSSPQGVADYFNSRVSYLLPLDTEVSAPHSMQFDASVLATNIGSLFWYAQLLKLSPLKVGKIDYQVSSGNQGLVLLGRDLLKEADKFNYLKLKTLIHEARHSDCSSKVSAEDLLSYEHGENMQDYSCGYPHILCPPGSDLEGLFACDAPVWGGYAIEVVLLQGLLSSCQNCDVKENENMEAALLEAAGRVEKVAELMSGKFGPPKVAKILPEEAQTMRKNAQELYEKRAAMQSQERR